MAKLRAAVLAAGRGVRMGGALPKTLIPVDDHEPLLYYIIAGLKKAGVKDLLVVTGFKPGDVEEYVAKYSEGLEVSYVHNARYASWGNFHSVRLAVDQSPGMQLLVVNSDVIVPPGVYARVAAAPGELVLSVQKRDRLDEEDMRVQVQKDRVLALGKQLTMARSHGEYTGVSLLRDEGLRAYSEISTDLEWRGDTALYYEDVYGFMLGRVHAQAVFVGPGEYAEVDVPEDMAAALRVIETHEEEFR